MTETLLISIIMCICNTGPAKNGTHDQKVDCLEKYANCAIVGNGKILDLEKFDNQCHFIEDQKRCY